MATVPECVEKHMSKSDMKEHISNFMGGKMVDSFDRYIFEI